MIHLPGGERVRIDEEMKQSALWIIGAVLLICLLLGLLPLLLNVLGLAVRAVLQVQMPEETAARES